MPEIHWIMMVCNDHLVGGLVAIWIIFPYIGLLIIPIDELLFFNIFQRGGPTTNQSRHPRKASGNPWRFEVHCPPRFHCDAFPWRRRIWWTQGLESSTGSLRHCACWMTRTCHGTRPMLVGGPHLWNGWFIMENTPFLVGGLEHVLLFTYFGNHHPNGRGYFSEAFEPPGWIANWSATNTCVNLCYYW